MSQPHSKNNEMNSSFKNACGASLRQNLRYSIQRNLYTYRCVSRFFLALHSLCALWADELGTNYLMGNYKYYSRFRVNFQQA